MLTKSEHVGCNTVLDLCKGFIILKKMIVPVSFTKASIIIAKLHFKKKEMSALAESRVISHMQIIIAIDVL